MGIQVKQAAFKIPIEMDTAPNNAPNGDIITNEFCGSAFNHHCRSEIDKNLNHCCGKSPQDKIDEADAVGNA